MKKRLSILVAVVLMAAVSAQALETPWFEDTFQSGSPAVHWDSGTYKYMRSTSVHGDGTLSPYGGGYKVANGYPLDQLYHHATSGSHFTGTNAGLWTVQASYTLLADPTNSHSGKQQARLDVRFSTIGGGVTFYLGEMKNSYASLVGTTSDMKAYGYLKFSDGSEAGKLDVRIGSTTYANAIDESWSTTYRIIADFDTATDTYAIRVCDDAAGLNTLVSGSGSVALQMGATTMNAMNGWMCLAAAGAGWGQDNFILATPEPATISMLCFGALTLIRRRK